MAQKVLETLYNLWSMEMFFPETAIYLSRIAEMAGEFLKKKSLDIAWNRKLHTL